MTIALSSLTADQITAARNLLGWSQDELAGRAGVSRGTISQFETGARRPSDGAGIEFNDVTVRLRGVIE